MNSLIAWIVAPMSRSYATTALCTMVGTGSICVYFGIYVLIDNVFATDGVAPSLQATQEKLQRQLNADRVSHQLEKRPSITDLKSQGVLDSAFLPLFCDVED